MGIATTKIVFRKDKLNELEEAPICIRIIRDRKISYVNTGIRINQKHWDAENQRVRKGHPNSARVNNIINQLLVQVTDASLVNQVDNVPATSKKIKELVFGGKIGDFFVVGEELTQTYQNKGEIGTFSKTRSVLNKIRRYVGKDNLPFNEITPKFIIDYQQYCLVELNNAQNTIAKDLRFMRTVFNYAIRIRYVDEKFFPFKSIPIKTEPTKRDFLTEDELDLLIDFYDENEWLNKVRDIALFQFYSGGVRISDIIVLRWEQINDDRINIVMRKTGVQLSNKLFSGALEILSKYKALNIGNDNKFVFRLLSNNIDLNNPQLIDKEISSKTAMINIGLKRIAQKCGINKNLTTHLLRHTFAMQALKKGIPLETIQSVLKHKNIRETQIYAKILNEQVDNELGKLFN